MNMKLQVILTLLSLARVARGGSDHLNEVVDGCEEEECIEVEEEECGLCHSIYMRECDIKMEYTYTPVKVEECRESACGKLGYTRKCRTKYYTSCSTDTVYHEMEEDHPVCKVEKQARCSKYGCRQVPVMRCRIEKKKVRKAKPSTSCRRVPQEECRKEKCAPRKCWERVRMSKTVVPKEECGYKERRVCHHTEDMHCRTIKRKHCKPASKPCRDTNRHTPSLTDTQSSSQQQQQQQQQTKSKLSSARTFTLPSP